MTLLRLIISVVLLAASVACDASPLDTKRVRVIDGDTIAVGGVVYRLVGFDAPETGDRAQCRPEAELGRRATDRMRAIIISGALDLERIACSCRPGTEGTRACNYGRACAVLRSKGRDVADIMVEEGLAHRYVCSGEHCPRRLRWCD